MVNEAVFEKRRWPYVLTMPISWLITAWVVLKKKVCGWGGFNIGSNSIFVDQYSHNLRLIKEGATSWRALDIIYNHRFGGRKTLTGYLDDFWIGMMNAQAVRNRFRLVKIELKDTLARFKNEGEVRLMSLACGSAQAVIDVVSELKNEGIKVKLLLIDKDDKALIHAKKLALERGVVGQVDVLRANILKVRMISETFRPHVIEMLGLLDYLHDNMAVSFISRIRDQLPKGGYFFTCNIRPNPEMHFIKHVVNWPMIYRTSRELSAIVTAAGFNDVQQIYEPLRIHGVIIAKKNQTAEHVPG
jgi:SAM-dependent methyltransferase